MKNLIPSQKYYNETTYGRVEPEYTNISIFFLITGMTTELKAAPQQHINTMTEDRSK